MQHRLDALLKDNSLAREEVAQEARRVIGLLRLQAKSMEQLPPANLTSEYAARLGLSDWLEATRKRAHELRMEADQFEAVAVAAGLLTKEETKSWSARGLLRGLEVREDDIEAAKKLFTSGT
jgi:hypothetical protein